MRALTMHETKQQQLPFFFFWQFITCIQRYISYEKRPHPRVVTRGLSNFQAVPCPVSPYMTRYPPSFHTYQASSATAATYFSLSVLPSLCSSRPFPTPPFSTPGPLPLLVNCAPGDFLHSTRCAAFWITPHPQKGSGALPI